MISKLFIRNVLVLSLGGKNFLLFSYKEHVYKLD